MAEVFFSERAQSSARGALLRGLANVPAPQGIDRFWNDWTHTAFELAPADDLAILMIRGEDNFR